MSKELNSASGCTGPSDCYVEYLQKVSVVRNGTMHIEHPSGARKTLCGVVWWFYTDHTEKYCKKCQRILAGLYRKHNASSATSRKTGKIMETGQALEIVHGMATRLYKRHGELDPASSPAEAQDALDTVEDFIVNNFEDGAEDTPNKAICETGD